MTYYASMRLFFFIICVQSKPGTYLIWLHPKCVIYQNHMDSVFMSGISGDQKLTADGIRRFAVKAFSGFLTPLLTYYRFDYCGAEKDGWRNLVSPEIFESLNPLAKKPSQLSVGETEELAMAIGLHKDAFRNTEWSNLSTSDISLVMSVYPQKVILQSS